MKKGAKKKGGTLYRLLDRYDGLADDYDASRAYSEQRSRELRSRLNSSAEPHEFVPSKAQEPDPTLVLQRIDRERYEKQPNARKKRKKKNVRAILEAEAKRNNPKPFEIDGEPVRMRVDAEIDAADRRVRGGASISDIEGRKRGRAAMGGAREALSIGEIAVIAITSLSLIQIIISMIILMICI